MEQRKAMLNKMIIVKKELDSLLKKRNNFDEAWNGSYYLESLNDNIIVKQIELSEFARIYFGNGLNLTEIENKINEEISNKAAKAKRDAINKICEQAIANLERKISDPEGYMEDALFRTRNFYNKKIKPAIYSDSNDNIDRNKEDVTYILKEN